MPSAPINPSTGLVRDKQLDDHYAHYEFGTMRGQVLKYDKESTWNVPRTLSITDNKKKKKTKSKLSASQRLYKKAEQTTHDIKINQIMTELQQLKEERNTLGMNYMINQSKSTFIADSNPNNNNNQVQPVNHNDMNDLQLLTYLSELKKRT